METSPRPEGAEALGVLARNLEEVRARIRVACERAGRSPDAAALLPVVKSVGPEVVALLHRLGVRDAAEGTLQGAQSKIGALPLLEGLRWHLVGHLQTNKARRAAGIFASIHSLDSARLAAKLDEEIARIEGEPGRQGTEKAPLLFLEVHNGVDAEKSGILFDEVPRFLDDLGSHPRAAARIAGLMIMAPWSEDPEAARPHFRRLRELRDRLRDEGRLPAGAGLSMGMSGDFPVAVEEGATVVRVGTRLFEGLPPAGPGDHPCR